MEFSRFRYLPTYQSVSLVLSSKNTYAKQLVLKATEYGNGKFVRHDSVHGTVGEFETIFVSARANVCNEYLSRYGSRLTARTCSRRHYIIRLHRSLSKESSITMCFFNNLLCRKNRVEKHGFEELCESSLTCRFRRDISFHWFNASSENQT